jgi:hypothetical protein
MKRARLSTWFIALSVLGNAGCGLVANATHNLTSGVHECFDDLREKKRDAAWAEEAWAKAAGEAQGHPFTEDHERGFKAGFTCFVANGGCGEPPPLPPKKYRCLRYQTPQGYQAIEDWFAGYRHGVAAARAGGYRDLVTGPSSLRPPAPIHPAEFAPHAPPAPPAPTILPAPIAPTEPPMTTVPAPLPGPIVPALPPAPAAAPANNSLPPPQAATAPPVRPVAGTTTDCTSKSRVLYRISINWDPWKLW